MSIENLLPAPRRCKLIKDPLNTKLVFSDELIGTLPHACYFHTLDCRWVRSYRPQLGGPFLTSLPAQTPTRSLLLFSQNCPLSAVPTAPTAPCDATVTARSSPQFRVPPSSTLE